MIKVDGYYHLKITIDKKEFADQWLVRLNDLSIIEQAGLLLPTIEMNFDTDDQDLIRVLDENREVTVTWGSEPPWSVGYELEGTFIIINPRIEPRGAQSWKVSIAGIHKFHVDYINSVSKINQKPLSSLEEITSILQPYGKVDCNIPNLKASLDDMVWSSHGVSLAKHLKNVWFHSNPIKDKSVTLLAPTLVGFRVYDLDILLSKPHAHTVDNSGGRSLGKIDYDPDYIVKVNSALTNTLGAKGIDVNVYNVDSGEMPKLNTDPKNKVKMVNSDGIQSNSNYKPLNLPTKFQSRNVHANWTKAEVENVNHLLLLSTISVTFTFDDCMRNIHPLDKVLFLERDLPESALQSTEQNSGFYIVTKVSRRLTGNRIACSVTMCRETQNLKPAK